MVSCTTPTHPCSHPPTHTHTHTHTHALMHPNTPIRTCTQLRDISMTQDMDPGHLNIITYDLLTGTKFILRAPKTSVRDTWLHRANELIQAAKQRSTFTPRGRSSSEPAGEYSPRSPSFMRRAVLKRESSKRKSVSRPQSGSGSRRQSTSPEQHVSMHVIVM